MHLFRTVFPLLIFLATLSLSAQTQWDLLRSETKLDEVYAQYNLNGQGVLVALIERGIDYAHPDFIDAQGNTRIAYIYDMLDPSGANATDNPYGIGTIFHRTDIDQALDGGPALPTHDNYGHGTACTGIAAGDGSGMTGAPYQGVAHGATIISVKVNEDFFPTAGTVTGQNGFFDPTYIPLALQFVKDKADELNLPVVALLNLGSIGGPTDGSSEVSRAMADFAGPGRILICGVGDDGGNANRAADTLTQGESVDLRIHKGTTGNLRFELWYEGEDRLDVSITSPNGALFGPFLSPATNLDAAFQQAGGFSYYHRGSEQDFSGADNGQRQILVDIGGDTGTYVFRLTGSTIQEGDFFASLNPSTYANENRFLNQVFEGGSIADYPSARNVIVPTDYVFDTLYTDIDGIPRSRGGQGAVGDLWIGSSSGPTLDGRLGVDIAVPGELSVGAYSPDTYYSQFRFNMMQGSNGLYGLQTAVSAAAPFLAGVVALMLEVNPELGYEDIRDILHQSAASDAFTGTVPNPRWGHGKLDALGAVQGAQASLSTVVPTLNPLPLLLYPNPASESISFRYSGPLPAVFVLRDMMGRKVMKGQLSAPMGSVPLTGVTPGLYEWSLEGNPRSTRILIR